jgi:predicted RND superfamily exporter protein
MANETSKDKNPSKLIDFIINKGKLIEVIFGITIILSVICFPLVEVNYDFSEYLPSDTPSKQGINLIKKEFGFPGTARIMVENVSLYQAKIIKDKIESVDGVDTVSWLDMPEDLTKLTDVYQSSDFINEDNIKDYYKDGCTVMDITFDEDNYGQRTSSAIDDIKKIAGDKGKYCGAAIQAKSYNENISKEAMSAMIVSVIVVALILMVTTTSWIEPLLFLLVIGIAIIINMGTNIVIGKVSFLTSSMASVLQLAVAMDYSIFLLHSFTSERNAGAEPAQAIANAIQRSFYSISACGFATIFGFLALMLMKFSIGFDLGFVLAKGIFISMLTVLFLMPSLIIRFSKLIEKTAHRPFLPSLDKASQWVYKLRYVVLIIALAIALPSYVAKGMNGFLYGNAAAGAGEGTKAYADEQAITDRFGNSNVILVAVPNVSIVKERILSDKLEDLSFVSKVVSLPKYMPEGMPESILPNSITGKFHTEKYARIIVFMNTQSESDYAFKCSEQITSIVKKTYPNDSYLTGMTSFTQDTKKTVTEDYEFVDMLSLLAVALVAAVAFSSILLSVLLLIPIEIAIFVNFALPYLTGQKLVFIGFLIVSCIQLAATVDYSILMTNNFLEIRSRFGKKEAIIETILESAPPILTSGSILASGGFALYAISTNVSIGSMGLLIGRGALLSMFLVVLLLPSLYYIFDKPIVSHMKRLKKLRAIRDEKILVIKQSLPAYRFKNEEGRNAGHDAAGDNFRLKLSRLKRVINGLHRP